MIFIALANNAVVANDNAHNVSKGVFFILIKFYLYLQSYHILLLYQTDTVLNIHALALYN